MSTELGPLYYNGYPPPLLQLLDIFCSSRPNASTEIHLNTMKEKWVGISLCSSTEKA